MDKDRDGRRTRERVCVQISPEFLKLHLVDELRRSGCSSTCGVVIMTIRSEHKTTREASSAAQQ